MIDTYLIGELEKMLVTSIFSFSVLFFCSFQAFFLDILEKSFFNPLPNDRILDSTKFKAFADNILTLPNNKILHQSKLKAFADDKMNVTKELKFVIGRVENTEGKGENAGYQHFLLFRQCFQNASFLVLLKARIVW